jgi:hypothetical protein
MKTGLLEVRPIVVRKAPRTRAHVLGTMLALKGVREMRRALVAAFGTTADDKMAVTVEEALLALARRCLLPYHVQGTAVTRLPTPEARPKAMLDALGTPLPPPRSVRPMSAGTPTRFLRHNINDPRELSMIACSKRGGRSVGPSAGTSPWINRRSIRCAVLD